MSPEVVKDKHRGLRQRSRWLLLGLLIFDINVAVGAPIVNYILDLRGDIPLSCGAAVIAVATFLGFLAVQREDPSIPNTDMVRDAIAASFVLMYLTILGWSTFFNYQSTEGTLKSELGPLASSFISNFTSLTGIVVAFYFGTSTVNRIADAKNRGEESKKTLSVTAENTATDA